MLTGELMNGKQKVTEPKLSNFVPHVPLFIHLHYLQLALQRGNSQLGRFFQPCSLKNGKK